MYQKIVLVLLSISIQGFCIASAQESKPDFLPRAEYGVRVDVETVFLNLSVRDRMTNRSLTGLEQHDFRVYEDGVPQEIQQFLPTESPFNLLLLMDVSGSTGSFIKLMKQAAIEFTREIKAGDRIAVATFNSKVKLVQDFTDDLEKTERAIKRIRSGGGTAFYDALMTSINQYMSGVQGRSAIVVFSDGIDNQLDGMPESGSRTSFEDLYRRIQEADMIMYTIFLNTEKSSSGISSGSSGPGWPGRRSRGFHFPFPFPLPTPNPQPGSSKGDNDDPVCVLAREQMQMIADQTGGRMYSPRKIAELSGVYSEIADDLRIQYQLGYNSTNRAHDGKWRSIKVELESNPDAVVRTRRGYYSRTQ